MIKTLFSPIALIALMLLSGPLAAQPRTIQFFMDICRFHDARVTEPTAEIYFSVDGTSVIHAKRADGKFHAAVKINWYLQKIEGSDSIGVAGDSFILDWPEGDFPDDTTSGKLRKHLFYFQYIQLPPGRYYLQAIVSDENSSSTRAAAAIHEFEMSPRSNSDIMFSDVKWVAYRQTDGPVRSRQDLYPLVSNDAFVNQDSMVFYQEIYNINKVQEGKIVIRARIYQGENILYAYEASQAKVAGSINAYLMSIPKLDKLRSNIYHLEIELLNMRNEVFSSYRKKFYVYNSRLEQDFEAISQSTREADLFNEYKESELDYYLRTLAWISTNQEKQFMQVLENYEQKKNYLYSFWEKRKKYPDQRVEALWRGHLAALTYVNQQFKSSLREGWITDRGRVFLKYGIPSDVERHPSHAAEVPWEMWRYDRLGAQTNVIFVFYDPDLATEEYPLLHSGKYGEIYNPRWQEQIVNRNLIHTPNAIDFEQNPAGRQLNQRLIPND